MNIRRDTYDAPASFEADDWRGVVVSLNAEAVSADQIEDMKEGVLDYVSTETFGLCPEDLLDEEGVNVEDHVELTFLKLVIIENATISLWRVSDDQDVWSEALVADAVWDRPPLRTKGSIISIGEANGLSPDQFIWRFFHHYVAEMLKP